MTAISLRVNGADAAGTVEPRTHLADFLRETVQLTGTHLRCEQGVCGACTLVIDGVPARSCITYAVSCQDAEVTTIEGLERDPVTASLRAAFSREHALQCGFCTPGMLVTARDIVTRLPDADVARVRHELSGNLCRCTGYNGIVRAISAVLEERKAAGSPRLAPSLRLGPVGARSPARMAGEASRTRDSAPPVPSVVAAPDDLGLQGRTPNLETATSIVVGRDAGELWAVFADIGRVARCMPGVTLTEPPEAGYLRGRVVVRFGPIASRFEGSGRLIRDDDNQQGTLQGTGRDGLSGSIVRADVVYTLHPAGSSSTRIDVSIRALLAGPLAQFGRTELVQDLIGRLAAEFSRRLEHMLEHGDSGPPAETAFRPGTLLLQALAARMGLTGLTAAIGRFISRLFR